MGASKAMQRLLRIREIEEEQRRLALESALGELRNLERARDGAGVRERKGRELVGASAVSGELADRQAGHLESVAARRHMRAMAPRIAASKAEEMRLRQEFLEKRVERRQAETLIEESAAKDAAQTGRRGQQGLDDWFGSRRHRDQGRSES
jgi:hypothetical protein